jgi:hypothetical protein
MSTHDKTQSTTNDSGVAELALRKRRAGYS